MNALGKVSLRSVPKMMQFLWTTWKDVWIKPSKPSECQIRTIVNFRALIGWEEKKKWPNQRSSYLLSSIRLKMEFSIPKTWNYVGTDPSQKIFLALSTWKGCPLKTTYFWPNFYLQKSHKHRILQECGISVTKPHFCGNEPLRASIKS